MFIYLKVLITFFQKNCIVYNTKAQWLVDINVVEEFYVIFVESASSLMF